MVVTVDLMCWKYCPYRKENNDQCYINRQSNHPPPVLAKSPPPSADALLALQATGERSMLWLHCTTTHLQPAEKLTFMADRKESTTTQTERRRTRLRKIIWFNPPYCKSVQTNIDGKWLSLVNKHIRKGGPLSKIFNHNTLKVSFSCMSNVATIITSYNLWTARFCTLSWSQDQLGLWTNHAGFATAGNCSLAPIAGTCLTSSVVYKAGLTEVDRKATKYYFGLTESTFKQHYANHQTNFRYEWYRNSGELSKHVWKLKDENKKFAVECSIQKKDPTFSPGSMPCQVPDRKTGHNNSRPGDAPQQTNRVDIDVQTAEKVLGVTVRSWLPWLVKRHSNKSNQIQLFLYPWHRSLHLFTYMRVSSFTQRDSASPCHLDVVYTMSLAILCTNTVRYATIST